MNVLGAAVALLFCVNFSAAQNTCVTPNKQYGTCVTFMKCPEIVEILEGPRPVDPAALQFIRSSQCGFEGVFQNSSVPKVCCENRSVPSPTVETTASPLPTPPTPPDVTSHPNLRLLEHNICGPISEQKIFGGNKTGVFDFPWMALIAYGTRNNVTEFRCGGTVINKRYVLTAAHCVTDLPNNIRLTGVRLGDHDISKERDCDEDDDGLEVVCAERYQDFGIESVLYHPQYSRTALQNDIALIRLNDDVDFRPANVRPICLPIGKAATISQKKVTVTGWGATEAGPRSQDLLKVLLSPVPNDRCAEIYRKSTVITNKQMCAGGSNKMDSCSGDSGGPLQSPGHYKFNNVTYVKYVQYGIVSFGMRACATEGIPGVYTRLDYFLDWVLDNIRE